ncbi:MAG: hypothetical protein ACLUPK_01485 [Veillonella sp.]
MKVANSTEKGIEITKEINAKKAELDAKIAAADEASKQNVFNQANQRVKRLCMMQSTRISVNVKNKKSVKTCEREKT